MARLDPSLFQTQVDSARANLTSAQADLQRAEVTLGDAQTKATRAHQLAEKQLIPATDVEAADVAERTADAQVRSAQAQLAQARASLTQTEVNLQKTVIASPIDGIVIGRSVDVGQTVAASLQAPTLFTLAADLGEMQVKTNIDESDLGNIRDGQPVTLPRRRVPDQDVHRNGHAGSTGSGRVAERRHLCRDHLGAEPGPRTEAGHDRQRDDRSGAKGRCSSRAVCGAAIQADREPVDVARSGSKGARAEPAGSGGRVGARELERAAPSGCSTARSTQCR